MEEIYSEIELKLLKLYARLSMFEAENLHDNIDVHAFFDKFYNLIYEKDSGIMIEFENLFRAILKEYNFSFWSNYYSNISRFDKKNIDKSKVFNDDRLRKLDEKEDISTRLFSKIVDDYETFTIHNLYKHLYFLSKIKIGKDSGNIKWEFDLLVNQESRHIQATDKNLIEDELIKAIGNALKERNNDISGNSDEEMQGSIQNAWKIYNSFLSGCFGLRDEVEIDSINNYHSYNYHWNLSYPNAKTYVGSINLFINKVLEPADLETLNFLIEKNIHVFGILNRIELEFLHNLEIKKLVDANIKSAIAAIMSRNMSHNLGSHVFYYVRNEISKLADAGDENNSLTPTHKGLVKFLQYVQERQDFVATITSQDEYFFAPLNLKLDVLDEITPDAVDTRHNSKPPSTNFVLKYLVNSENIARHDNETIGNSIKEIEIEILFRGNSFKSKDSSVKAVDFYDIDIAVQGGQQSRHAFLIIIENIIRNAAKHGFDKKISDELKIQIKIDQKGDNYEIIISDNCKNSNFAKPIIQGYLDNLKILGTSGEESINREHKGLKEILVCVAWLKGVRLSKVFKPVSGIHDNLLEVVAVEGNLGYKFTLPVFNKNIEINEQDLFNLSSNHSKYKKFGLVYTCPPELLKKARKYFPRCVPNNIVGNVPWNYLSKIKYNSIKDDDLPVIIFERKGLDTNEGLFYFKEDEEGLTSLVNDLGHKKFILFKNHLAKSEGSLSAFFESSNLKKLFNGNNPIFVENLSGATYSFNLFQISQTKEKQNEIYYRILEAFYTKIVIIDERLCPIEVPFIDELFGLITDSSKTKEFVYKYINKSTDSYYIPELNQILNSNPNDLQIERSMQADLVKWWNNTSNADKKTSSQINTLNPINYYMKQRNIFMFSMDRAGIPYDQNGERVDSFSDLNPDFLSIHIGLLDKLIEFENSKGSSTKEKLKLLKEKLEIPDKTHIAVHSGRGGLTDKNKDITFIPFANLQWAFENSKYMLSELFHNQIYFPI